MATLERGRSTERTLYSADPSQSAVPTPFPAVHAATTQQQERSPSGGAGVRRASLSRAAGGIMDKMKRAISQSRDRSSNSDYSATRDNSRGRRESVDTMYTDEPRGRSPLHAATPSLIGSQTLTSTATRSTSRGRALLSTGRGGAGNMKGVAEAGEADGEEPAEVMQKARAEVERERSESRERMGREEMVGSGRGGKGNIRSTSRGRELEGGLGRVPTVQEEQERVAIESELEVERRVLQQHLKNAENHRTYSTGRGGAGNIRNSSADKNRF